MKAIVDGAAQFDPAQQTPVLQAVIRKQPDAIALDPTDPKALVAPVKQAVDAGIQVMTTGNTVQSELPFAQISADQYGGARLAAEQMKQLLPDGGKVVVIAIKAGIPAGDQREQGFVETLKQDPKFTVLPTQRDEDNDVNHAASLTGALLRAHPDLKGIFGIDLNVSVGIANQLRLAGKAGKVKAIGFDAGPQEASALKSGLLQGLVSQNPRQLGQMVAQSLHAKLTGGAVQAKQTLKPVLVTKDNVDTPAGRKALYTAGC
jgi:ribose transport system substrate-binding protein